jgi:hypothetical protein
MATKVQGSKNRQAAAIKEKEILESVDDVTLDSVTSNITGTQLEVQKSLADLSAKLMEQVQVLRDVEEAIRLKQEELKQLHSIETTATTLDDLEAQIAAQRRAWDEEQAAKKREFAEMQSERNKTWARQEEEYQYRTAQQHKKQEDEFQALIEKREKENRDRQEQLEKAWAEREAELKKREQELADLRSFKDNAPEVVKKEVNAAVAVATNSVKKEYETKMVLAAKDYETAQKLSEQTINSLKETIAKQQAQLEDVRAQLEQAHRDMKEISAKALESASGRATTEALQRLLEKDQVVGAKVGK